MNPIDAPQTQDGFDKLTTSIDELRAAALGYTAALYGPDGLVCVPRETELAWRAEIGRLSAEIRRAEQEGRR